MSVKDSQNRLRSERRAITFHGRLTLPDTIGFEQAEQYLISILKEHYEETALVDLVVNFCWVERDAK